MKVWGRIRPVALARRCRCAAGVTAQAERVGVVGGGVSIRSNQYRRGGGVFEELSDDDSHNRGVCELDAVLA